MAEKDAVVEVMKAVDLVEYQDEAVVSRPLVQGKTASITLFAFGMDQELSEHTTPYDAWVYLLDGRAEITVAGTLHRLGEGDILLMPANRPHAVKAVSRFKMMLTMIKPEEAK